MRQTTKNKSIFNKKSKKLIYL